MTEPYYFLGKCSRCGLNKPVSIHAEPSTEAMPVPMCEGCLEMALEDEAQNDLYRQTAGCCWLIVALILGLALAQHLGAFG